ncbi:hypothetical protein LINPERHAP1_LOCUS20412, partial [Linum perenne]
MDANFHGLLDLQVDLINKELCSFMMASYDPKTRTFVFPNGEVLTVEPTDVARVYGLPSHGIPINIKSCPTAERRKFEATSGLGGNRHNNIKLATLKKSIEECQDGNAFSRMYILHTLGTLLVPGNSWKISLNYAKYLNEEFSLIGQLNWGKYVVDTLLMGLDDFQSKLSYPSGDFNFLVVSVKEFSYGTIMAQLHFLDMVELEGLSAPTSPICGYWDDGRVSDAVQMMKPANGDWNFKLKSREGLKTLPLAVTPWIDELFESVRTQPTQPTQPSSSAPPAGAINLDGSRDTWAQVVNESVLDLTQLALLKAIAEAEVKTRIDLISSLRAECTFWEARQAVVVERIEKAPQDALNKTENEEEDKEKGDEDEDEDEDGDEDEDEDEDGDEDEDEDENEPVVDTPVQNKGDNSDKAVDAKKEDSSSSESSSSEEAASSDDDDLDDEPENGEEIDSSTSSSDESNDEGPSVGDIGKAAVAQAEKEIQNETDTEKETPVLYDRPKTWSKAIGSPYVLEKRLQRQLTVDENILITYVLRKDERVGEKICIFPEKGNTLVRLQASTLAYNTWLCSSVVNAIGHYLNIEHMAGKPNITRMCFPICVAVAAREEVEAKRQLSLSDSIVAQRMAEYANPANVPCLKNKSWNTMKY